MFNKKFTERKIILEKAQQKKVAWLNTVRVFASLTIIITHYVGLEQFEHLYRMNYVFHNVGHVGIFLFFAVSGYLASNSLSRSPSILEFYRRKLIRIVIPFSTAYVVLGTFFVMLSIIEPSLIQKSPFVSVIYYGGDYTGILFGIIPVDINLIHYFNLTSYIFVGEWFIGMIVYMYLIAPFLDKFIKFNLPLAFVCVLIVSITVFFGTDDLQNSRRIVDHWWFFLVRAPEFLIGMVIFVYKDFLLKHKRILIKTVSAYMVLLLIWVYLYSNNASPIFDRLCVHHPIAFIFSLPAIYLLFNFAEYLNENFSEQMAKFNSYSDISYMAMLIQHVVIYLFADCFDMSNFTRFGIIFIFILITKTIIFTSEKLRVIYKPIEEYFIDKSWSKK